MKIHKHKAAIVMLYGESYDGEANVVCPNCQCEYTHVHHVGTLVGSDPIEAVVYAGTTASGSTPLRRSAVEVVFSCEGCLEYFSLVIQQHKGTNFIEIHENV